MSEFDDWFSTSKYGTKEIYASCLYWDIEVVRQAFNAGRKLQREKDACIADKTHFECPVSESIWICAGNEEIAKAIREQEVDG